MISYLQKQSINIAYKYTFSAFNLCFRIFEVPSSSLLEGATNEYTAQLYSMCASNILDTNMGK
jgi:hypothetical protein